MKHALLMTLSLTSVLGCGGLESDAEPADDGAELEASADAIAAGNVPYSSVRFTAHWGPGTANSTGPAAVCRLAIQQHNTWYSAQNPPGQVVSAGAYTLFPAYATSSPGSTYALCPRTIFRAPNCTTGCTANYAINPVLTCPAGTRVENYPRGCKPI